MRSDILEVMKIFMTVGLCVVTFGFAWAVTAPEGWGWYGAVIALLGLCAVILAALVRIFVYDEPTQPHHWDRDQAAQSNRPSEYEVERQREAWWGRQDFINSDRLRRTGRRETIKAG